MYRSTIVFQKKKENQIKGIKISNDELYAVQQTRLGSTEKKTLIIFVIVKYGHKKK